MRLYHHPLSSNSRRAALAAAHLGLPAELVKIDLERGQQRSPEFLRMNPNGMVPVLEDDGFILTESHAIMLYLADKIPGHAAYPDDARRAPTSTAGCSGMHSTSSRRSAFSSGRTSSKA